MELNDDTKWHFVFMYLTFFHIYIQINSFYLSTSGFN